MNEVGGRRHRGIREATLARAHAEVRPTETGGREATTRHIPPKLALAVGMPSTPPPQGWRWVHLTDIARLESGHTPSRKHPEWWGGSIPWISISDARANHGKTIAETLETTNELGIKNSSARILPARTVCLSRTASVGYVMVMGRPMATSQDFVNWVCSSEIEPDFLKYLFIAEGDDLLRFASGAVHQTIYFPEAKAFHVCIPSRLEQQRIITILNESFEGIATAKANAEKNVQNARAILDSHLDHVFSSRGPGWARRRLGDLFDIGSSKRIYETDWVSSGVPFYGGREIVKLAKSGIVVSDAYISEEKYSEYASKYDMPREGDILITARGTIGVGYVVNSNEKFYYKDGNIISLRAKVPTNPRFILYAFGAKATRDQLAELSGATVTHLPIEKAKQLFFAVPDLPTQDCLVGRLESIEKESRRLESIYKQKLDALHSLKNSLLHEAFSGNL